MIVIRSLIKTIWPNMKGAADFSLFKMKNYAKLYIPCPPLLSFYIEMNYVYDILYDIFSLIASYLCYRYEVEPVE